jgi:hypothetical protein
VASDPLGHAATAAELLNAAAGFTVADASVRQVVATRAIGYALLAIADQLADLTDATADSGAKLDDAADLITEVLDPAEILGPHVVVPFRRVFGTLRARRSGGAR